jgi:uncharacterized protein YeaO (DUF488 family)
MHIRLKRVYDKPEVGDGCRIFVDRLWPRGVAKQEANISRWLKDIALSTGVRKWFGHSSDTRAGVQASLSGRAGRQAGRTGPYWRCLEK